MYLEIHANDGRLLATIGFSCAVATCWSAPVPLEDGPGLLRGFRLVPSGEYRPWVSAGEVAFDPAELGCVQAVAAFDAEGGWRER